MKIQNKLLVKLAAPVFLGALLGVCLPGQAQNLSMDWYTVDGGGGSTTASGYTLSGTIGQPDAGLLLPRPPGGAYAISGGFWGLFDGSLPSFGPFRLCFRDGNYYNDTNRPPVLPPVLLGPFPISNFVLLEWPDAGLKLQAAGELAGNPANTVWADVAASSYRHATDQTNTDLCGNLVPNYIWSAILKRSGQAMSPETFQTTVTPLVPALFSTALNATNDNVFDSSGKGSGDFRLSTSNGSTYTVALDIAFAGLRTNATAAHIHGPAGPGTATNVLYSLAPFGPLGTNYGAFAGTLTLVNGTGGFTVAQQLDQLRSGLWYVNVHSTRYPAGEIRGQINLKQQFFRAVPQ